MIGWRFAWMILSVAVAPAWAVGALDEKPEDVLKARGLSVKRGARRTSSPPRRTFSRRPSKPSAVQAIAGRSRQPARVRSGSQSVEKNGARSS